MHFQKNKLTLLIYLVLPQLTLASPLKNEVDLNHNLIEILVHANEKSPLSSEHSLDTEQIKNTPVSNGNVTDYVKMNPNVRYEYANEAEGNDGLIRGEIKPEMLSINGAPANQTAYLIDGVNINNELGLDTTVFDGSMGVVPYVSSEQAYFFDAPLLSEITVYDNNIPARLSGFTGGAVVAKTKQYTDRDRIKLRYRTTRSQWAKIHTNEGRETVKDAVPLSSQAIYQPKYRKNMFSIVAEKKLGEQVDVILGLSHRDSEISQARQIDPQGNMDKQNQTRRSDNFLANFSFTPQESMRLEWGIRYSDYLEKKFYANNIQNNVKDYHKAYGSTLAWKQTFNTGLLTTTIAYDLFQDKRRSNAHEAKTIVAHFDDPYEVVENYESGGYGDSDLTQYNTQISFDYLFNEVATGNTIHAPSVGVEYRHTQYRFLRHQDVFGSFQITHLNRVPVASGTKGEIHPRDIAHAGQVDTSYQNFAVYAEDTVNWNTFSLRSGVRIERDNYLNQTNIAPRFSAYWQALENTGVNFGLNRYYGRSFAGMKLSSEILKLSGRQGTSEKFGKFDHLKTPYSNEVSLALLQNVHQIGLKASYIYRQYKNPLEVIKKNRLNYYTNGGDYNAHIYTLEAQTQEPLQWGISYWKANVAFDWLDSKRADLDRNVSKTEPVIYNGKVMTRQAMRQKINNHTEKWFARLGLDMHIPSYHLSWNNQLSIQAPRKDIEEIGEINNMEVYRSHDFGQLTQWDTQLRWQPQIAQKHQVYLQFDILNVLDKVRKNKNVSNVDIYTPGREFWIELGYEF